MRTSTSTNTLDKLINTAIDINVKLYELRQELRDDPRAQGTTACLLPMFNKNPWRNSAARRGD
jgi:hypothetical protein